MKLLAVILVVCLVLGCFGWGPELLDQLKLSDVTDRLKEVQLPDWLKQTEPTEPTETTEMLAGLSLVKQMLAEPSLPETAAPVAVGSITEEDELLFYGANVAQEMKVRQSNPIALFHALTHAGLYAEQERTNGFSFYGGFDSEWAPQDVFLGMPEVPRWQEQKKTDPNEFLCQLLRLSSFVSENAKVSAALLNYYESTGEEFFTYSEEDHCYYSYSIESTERDHSQVMAIYLHEPDHRGQFHDVEIQFLQLYYRLGGYAGCSVGEAYSKQQWLTQTAATICAVEKLMTGQTYFDREDAYEQYTLPDHYNLGEYQVSVSYAQYDCTFAAYGSFFEGARLVNYRLCKP